MARIVVFRDDSGAVGRLRYDGDLGTCSHPPRLYFDANGTQTLVLAERPVENEAEAKELARQRAAQVEGLTEAETLRCPKA